MLSLELSVYARDLGSMLSLPVVFQSHNWDVINALGLIRFLKSIWGFSAFFLSPCHLVLYLLSWEKATFLTLHYLCFFFVCCTFFFGISLGFPYIFEWASFLKTVECLFFSVAIGALTKKEKTLSLAWCLCFIKYKMNPSGVKNQDAGWHNKRSIFPKDIQRPSLQGASFYKYSIPQDCSSFSLTARGKCHTIMKCNTKVSENTLLSHTWKTHHKQTVQMMPRFI